MSKQQATFSKLRSTLSKQSTFDFVATNWQQCRMSIVKFRPFYKVECCFDIVTEHVQFVWTLSKWRNFVRHCCRNRQRCCQKRQRIVKLVAFDNVASTLLLVWTALLRQPADSVPWRLWTVEDDDDGIARRPPRRPRAGPATDSKGGVGMLIYSKIN